MPYTYNGIGTIYYGSKNYREYQGACSYCGFNGKMESYETMYFFVVLFIPVIPLGRRQILDNCPSCSHHKAVPLKEWKELEARVLGGGEQKQRHPANQSERPPADQSEREQTDQSQAADSDTPDGAIAMHANLVTFSKKEEAEALAGQMAGKFPSHADLQYYLGSYYRRISRDTEAHKCFERAMQLDPGNEEYLRPVGIYYLENGNLSRAADLLSFMRNTGPNQNSEVLHTLASQFMERGEHSRAYSYYEVIARDFPSILTSDKRMRKNIKKLEKQMGGSKSILPAHQHALLVKGIAAVVLIIAAATFFLDWTLSKNQTLHLVNQLKAPATVTIPGQKPVTIEAKAMATVSISEGEYDIAVTVKDVIEETYHVEISNKALDRILSNNLFILNVGRGGVFLWEKIVYSERPDPNAQVPYRYYVGQPLIKISKVDYLFKPSPESLRVESGSSVAKYRMDIVKAEPSESGFAAFNEQLPADDVLTYLEAHLRFPPDDENLLRTYADLCGRYAELDRELAFLSKGLTHRPLRIHWHRFYQQLMLFSGKKDQLFTLYDGMLQKEPGNSRLLYLRGRLEATMDQAFLYYDRAIAADENFAFAYNAKAYHLFIRGRFKEAFQQSTEASLRDPAFSSAGDMDYQLRFALGHYDALEKELSKALSASPNDWDFYRQLLEVKAAKKDTAGMKVVLASFLKAHKKSDPADQYGFSALAKLMHAYLVKDFSAFATFADAFNSPQTTFEYLAQSYLILGQMEKQESLYDAEKCQDGYRCLLCWLGWLEKGNKEKAAPWLARAEEIFPGGSNEEKAVGRLLKEKPSDIIDILSTLRSNPENKRILYVAFSRLYPKQRRKLLKEAKKMNYLLRFPHFFLEKLIKKR
ncbi:MAG: hypothetical protein GY765_12005 [bacterium]|nr:hypothetical protein [bacterium]